MPDARASLLEAFRVVVGTGRAAAPRTAAAALCALAWRENACGVLVHAGVSSPEIDAVAASTFAMNMRYQALLAALDAQLEARDVEAMVLKGAALLHSVYAGRTSLRPLSDIDLLVRAADRAAVEACLGDLGLRCGRSEPAVWRGDGLAVDLHERPAGDRIRNRVHAFRLDEAALWRASMPLCGDLRRLRAPALEDHVLLLAVHALKHSHERLVWLLDLALMLQFADAAALARRAEETGCTRVLALTCLLVRQLFALDLDGERLHPLERAYARRVAQGGGAKGAGELLLALSVRGTWARLMYLWEICFPRMEVMARQFPGAPRWCLPLVRVKHLAILAWQELSRAGRRRQPPSL